MTQRGEGNETDRRLRALLDEKQIRDVLLSYCQGVDRRTWETVRACYHDDAIDSHGAFVGDPDALVAWLQQRHQAVISSMHMLSNISIRFSEDRRVAKAESYCLSHQIVDPTSGDPFAGGGDDPIFTTVACRFIDVFEETPTLGWRIRRRDVAFEWLRRSDMSSFVQLDDRWTQSRRDASDVLYSPFPVDSRLPVD